MYKIFRYNKWESFYKGCNKEGDHSIKFILCVYVKKIKEKKGGGYKRKGGYCEVFLCTWHSYQRWKRFGLKTFSVGVYFIGYFTFDLRGRHPLWKGAKVYSPSHTILDRI